METQTWLSRHNKFISVEDITILAVSSDDFYNDDLTKFEFPSDYTIYALNGNFLISQ